MRRSGENLPLDSGMDFQEGKRVKGIYGTPFGPIEMELLTNAIVNRLRPEQSSGSLDIDYQLCLRGLMEGRNRLCIEIAPGQRMPGAERGKVQ
jgi:uncharacterized beta-barrel protein YwiB (DUF1934 family)